jgi:WD40 repeat protein
MEMTKPPARRRLAFAALLALAACRGSDARGTGGDAGAGAEPPRRARTASAPDAIAYVAGNGRELRLVQPDGSRDRPVWHEPDTLYSITAPSWRPDGTEIGFASNHEMAVSFYERDVYAIGPDGAGMRKLTNPPAHGELAGRPKGTVTVTVQNASLDGGPFFVYVAGAPQPQRDVIPMAGSRTFTFRDVADLGDGVQQPVVAISGINRWWDAAVAPDVKAGSTADAGMLTVGGSPIEHFGADWPMWRADGSAVGFIFGPTCLLQYVPDQPKPGPSFQPLLDPKVFGPVCAVDWAPAGPRMGELLVADLRDFTGNGQTHVLRVAEGSTQLPAPVATFDGYTRIADLRWLPDGSGFLVAKQDALTDEDINLYEFSFATRRLRKVTDFTGEFVRHFSPSPDGSRIVFERTRGSIHDLATLPSDLWIVNRDGSGLRPLVRNAAFPAWNPQR